MRYFGCFSLSACWIASLFYVLFFVCVVVVESGGGLCQNDLIVLHASLSGKGLLLQVESVVLVSPVGLLLLSRSIIKILALQVFPILLYMLFCSIIMMFLIFLWVHCYMWCCYYKFGFHFFLIISIHLRYVVSPCFWKRRGKNPVLLRSCFLVQRTNGSMFVFYCRFLPLALCSLSIFWERRGKALRDLVLLRPCLKVQQTICILLSCFLLWLGCLYTSVMHWEAMISTLIFYPCWFCLRPSWGSWYCEYL